MAGHPEYDYLFKILLVGEAGAGKSSLLLRFADDTFTESYVSTIGVDFKIRTVDIKGKTVKLQMWDTAGQERFRTITSSYYRGAQGIVVCFDLATKRGFSKLDDWVKEIERYAEQSISLMLCGLKMDLESQRCVPKEEVQAFAALHKMRYMEASPKNGAGVEETFILLANDIYNAELNAPPKEATQAPLALNPSTSRDSKCAC